MYAHNNSNIPFKKDKICLFLMNIKQSVWDSLQNFDERFVGLTNKPPIKDL